jgi:hypothetical protein
VVMKSTIFRDITLCSPLSVSQNTRGLNLAAVRRTTVQVTRLPL